MKVTNENVAEVMRGLEKYLREKFEIPNKANLRYDYTTGHINYLHVDYYDVPVDGEDDIFEVKGMKTVTLISKPTAEQIQTVNLIKLQLELLTAALLKE
ncbi:hypothetical protein RsoM2USA_191 [Ralstonia phage RsoM2USA]|nr:hypothetical protein RsoM2USA_191 [Ralstonia phage RsoM2USA]